MKRASFEATREPDDAHNIMPRHVAQFYEQARSQLTAEVAVHLGNDVRAIKVDEGSLLSGAVIAAGLPLEQPCAGRGTCGKCKIIAEGALSPLDEREQALLTMAERATHFRLACRAQVMGDVTVTLAPIVVYSDKIFRVSNRHLRGRRPARPRHRSRQHDRGRVRSHTRRCGGTSA